MPKIKTKKEYPLCYQCQKEMTGKVNLVGDKKYCFKCFVIWRTQYRLDVQKRENEWITAWIRLKKYLCPKCGERRSDTGVAFSIAGIMCLKCGTVVNKINDIEHDQFKADYLKELLKYY